MSTTENCLLKLDSTKKKLTFNELFLVKFEIIIYAKVTA